jgi:hypothetical protein
VIYNPVYLKIPTENPPRHLFSPSESVDDSDTTSVNTVEFVPDQVRSVKEKARMITQQQEEIVRR